MSCYVQTFALLIDFGFQYQPSPSYFQIIRQYN